MSFSDIFRNLKIDTWYKAFVYLGGFVLVISLFVEVKGITSAQLQLLSAGFFFIGIGEWKNHKVASWIKPPNVYTGPAALIQAPVRKVDLVGIILDIVGLVLVILGAWSIIKANLVSPETTPNTAETAHAQVSAWLTLRLCRKR